MLIARTIPRERMAVNNGVVWREFRLNRVNLKTFNRLAINGHIPSIISYSPWILFDRYIKTDDDIRSIGEWHFLTCGESARETVDDYIGDSGFLEATSLHPIHSLAISNMKRLMAAKKEVYDAEEALKIAAVSYEGYKNDCNAIYRLKASKLGDDKAAVEKLYQKLFDKFKPQVDVLRNHYEVCKTTLEEAKVKLKELSKP